MATDPLAEPGSGDGALLLLFWQARVEAGFVEGLERGLRFEVAFDDEGGFLRLHGFGGDAFHFGEGSLDRLNAGAAAVVDAGQFEAADLFLRQLDLGPLHFLVVELAVEAGGGDLIDGGLNGGEVGANQLHRLVIFVDLSGNFDRILFVISRLVDRFYEGVRADAVLRPLYPEEDLTPAARRLTLFLVQYWGGPGTYTEERGHPRLRMRHVPFAIGSDERDRWMTHMRAAVQASGTDPDTAGELVRYFEMAAEAMRNQER